MVGMQGLDSRLSTYSPTNGDVLSAPLPIKLISLAFLSRHLGSSQKGVGVKSGRYGALKPGQLGCKANKYCDAETPTNYHHAVNYLPNR